MEKELLEKEEVVEEISCETAEELIEKTVEEPIEETVEETAEEAPKEEEPTEETNEEVKLQVNDAEEGKQFVEESGDKFELSEKKEKKSFKKIWGKFSLAILLAAFSIPVAILAYILILFFLM